jgi:ribosome silencing factor RsfS/YbeB/iojap
MAIRAPRHGRERAEPERIPPRKASSETETISRGNSFGFTILTECPHESARNTTVRKFGLYWLRADHGAWHARGRFHFATSEKRVRPRKAGTRVSKTPAARKTPAKAAKAKTAPVKALKTPRTRKKPSAAQPADRLRSIVLAALDDLKARDVREVDVRGKSSVTDLLVVASGTSSRHVKSIADEVVKKAKQAGLPPIGVEGQREAEWVLVDLGDIVVHVMLPRTREFYGLERLWTVGDEMPAALAG